MLFTEDVADIYTSLYEVQHAFYDLPCGCISGSIEAGD